MQRAVDMPTFDRHASASSWLQPWRGGQSNTSMSRRRWSLCVVLVTLAMLSAACGAFHSKPSNDAAPESVAGGVTLLSPAQAIKYATFMIDNADKGDVVDLEMYELGQAGIVQALRQAYERGAHVRVILDATEDQSMSSAPLLLGLGIPVERVLVPNGLDHVKLLVTQQGVLTGGVNDGKYSQDTVDLDYLLAKSSDIKAAEAVFDADWQAASTGASLWNGTSGPFLVGRSIEPVLLAHIDALGPGWSCYGAENYLSDYQVRDALEAAAHKGALIDIVLNPDTSETATTLHALLGGAVHVEQAPDKPYLHAKVLACEDSAGAAWSIGGSANLSYDGMSVNHELDVEFSGADAQAVYNWAKSIWIADR